MHPPQKLHNSPKNLYSRIHPTLSSLLFNNLPNTLRKDRTSFPHILLAHIQGRNKPDNLINARCQNQHPFFDAPPCHPGRHVFGMLAVVMRICAVWGVVRRGGGRGERCRGVARECGVVRAGGGGGELDTDHEAASANINDVGVERRIVFKSVEGRKEFVGPLFEI